MMSKSPLFTALLLSFLILGGAQAEEASSPAGEIGGEAVSQKDFDFAYKTTGIFSAAGQDPSDSKAHRAQAWQHLIFVKEADRRGIVVSRDELQAEMTRLVAEKNIKLGSYEYHEFIKTNFQEDAKTFEKRLEELLRVKKLLDGIMRPSAPKIDEADAKQKFLNQYNSMNVEFVTFPTLEEAQAFQKKMTAAKWSTEKSKDEKFSTPSGFITLEAFIELWKLPKEHAYRIHGMKVGEISAPAPMLKGYAVYHLKEKKDADLKDYTETKKEEYLKTLEQVYYYNNSQKVVQDIIDKAALKDFEKEKMQKNVVVETNQGTFEVKLFADVAPKAVENFTSLAEKKYYDGTVFHRVIDGFMIQGGDPTATGRGGESVWGKPFEDEVTKDVKFDRAGLLAMANAGPRTNGSQFFVTLAPTPHLNMNHTIFGEVVSGMDVVQKIGSTSVGPNDKPRSEQKIVRMTVKK